MFTNCKQFVIQTFFFVDLALAGVPEPGEAEAAEGLVDDSKAGFLVEDEEL